MKNTRSLYAFVFSAVLLLYAAFIFYPRWQKNATEATLSWDATGYYWPLPAFFIYKDVKKLSFSDTVLKKYVPTPEFQQAVQVEKGNYIFRYSFGTAVMYLPFFLVAHSFAEFLGYPADGFSEPYQFAVQAGGLLVALLGLWYLRKLFLLYYSDKVVAAVLLILTVGTNYLNYAAIDNALPHTWLFTLYVLLILNTRYFYELPSVKYALRIGLLAGLITLVRPPDAICALIPALWGINRISLTTVRDRVMYILRHRYLYLLMAGCVIGIASIQLVYWKIVGGHWIMDTYPGQGFSFSHPHFFDYIFSYRSGWVTYTPMALFMFAGALLYLWKGPNRVAILTFSVINLYIVASWDIWWYAGSGGRAMIQSYAVLLFPVASLVEYVWEKAVIKWLFLALALLFAFVNIWFTTNAHNNGFYDSEGMNRNYYWRVVGRWSAPEGVEKIKDYDEFYEGETNNMKLIYGNDFESDTTLNDTTKMIAGKRSYVIDANHPSSGWFKFKMPGHKADRLRAQATFHCVARVWNSSQWSQLIVRFYKGDSVVKEKMIFVDRMLASGMQSNVYIDVKIPSPDVDSAGVSFWAENSVHPIYVDNLKVWTFDEN